MMKYKHEVINRTDGQGERRLKIEPTFETYLEREAARK